MTTREAIRIVRGAQAARASVLARKPLDEITGSPELQSSIERLFGKPMTLDQVVATILNDVRNDGDTAVQHYSTLLDGGAVEPLRVSAEEIERAWQSTPQPLRDALTHAAERIAAFHQLQKAGSWLNWGDEGTLGQMVRPLERVGIYAPNGRVPYPSSLLMAAVPAKVAGVPHVVVATPPRGGQLSQTILAAAYAAGVDEVYAVGGAQAIGALAYGTASIPRVDKILGPGNIFVVLAKRRVYGSVDIDQLPGPTETLLVADESANPVFAAADMLAQAEHDPLASAILITPSCQLAERVQAEIGRQLTSLSRAETIRASLESNGAIVLAEDVDEAIQLANEYAPEHLCLLLADAWERLGQVRNAGGVFVGEWASEALGDYAIGPSHIMPTNRTARFSSPVNIWDFVKITSVFNINPDALPALSATAITLAEEEGLTAHAQAVRVRLQACDQEVRHG